MRKQDRLFGLMEMGDMRALIEVRDGPFKRA
jgi:hypothetical protein